ncbi:fumarylacetoacetate hydrolase [Aureimonas ureilytica]|uniref:Fumarylacetoacetate hydrolase n=1 Tax=Aureimonas ureilytica TaxID=401562 RepID=A0A175R9W3_9HYPH|nr:fumarylacetoacetate hydrolase family protein [Aureimonas ureilytica]KTQ95333.1 fumarylacetoacetate hydrolase [Aureimonas ureilytica]
MSHSSPLPTDATEAVLVGRLFDPEVGGPVIVHVRGDRLVDVSALAPTVSELLEGTDVAARLRAAEGGRSWALSEVLAASEAHETGESRPILLAPCDLQAVKACGVTFARSMVERVIEERAKGDYALANAIRQEIGSVIGGALADVVPGSPKSAEVKRILQDKGYWSQYLEVGIGPDAEVFTKAPVLASVGHGAEVGILPMSEWNNPEPEVVLTVNSRGEILGATLGNDVNLRDVEGRSALLLGKAKDNNASSSIGPFIRLFDEGFTLDDVRSAELTLIVEGADDGYRLEGFSTMREISRDPADLVRQALGPHHQYPDGMMLFCGTLFAPVEDRDTPGKGFTHKLGDRVTIASPRLGALTNTVTHTDKAAPWRFGIAALMRNLAARGLLS